MRAPVKPTKAAGYFGALDGMRGVAAITVVAAHTLGTYRDSSHPAGLTLRFLKGVEGFGHPAVVLFYVLSGFVLYAAYLKRPDIPFATYLVRRLFRIYPALLAALILALVLHGLQRPVATPLLGPWATFYWVYDVDPLMVLRNALMLNVSESDRLLNPVSWSLALELRFSALLYPLALLLRRSRWALIALGAASYVGAQLMLAALHMSPPYQIGVTVLGSLPLTLHYLPGFCAGMVAADLILASRERPLRFPAWGQIAIFIAAVVLSRAANEDMVTALAAAVAIFAVATPGPVERLLNAPVTQFLGRTSYSLYLVHLPILMATAYWLGPLIGLLPALATVPVTSILVAAALRRWTELPGIELGKRATGAARPN